MFLDGHIHTHPGKAKASDLLRRMKQAGAAGGVILSPAPPSFGTDQAGGSPRERMDCVLEWTAGSPSLYPFFWIDPTESGAVRQVTQAARAGAAGFKIICTHFFPADRRAMKVYAAIAEGGRPLLLHSSILWNPSPSSRYCRPVEFEPLFLVPRLRFALAHIGWPWCDELLAVYGKGQATRAAAGDNVAEMFIDTTPGTPPIYRREALTKLYTIGYDVENNVLFGTDCLTRAYDVKWAKSWLARDGRICQSLRVPAAAQKKLFGENLLRFVGQWPA
jgi:predicted TIM-barrel fold metal-dependent hydrolase